MVETYKPQWGRSVNLKLPIAQQKQQLVRLKFDSPRDVTVYLQGATSDLDAIATRYQVSAGIGGVAMLDEEIVCPVVGMAQHWVCDTINVDALIDPQLVQLPPSPQGYRYAATAGPGTGVFTIERARIVAETSSPPHFRAIAPIFSAYELAEYAWYRVPLWSNGLAIHVPPGQVFDPAEVVVQQCSTNGGPLEDPRSIAEMDEFVPLSVHAWWIKVRHLAPPPGGSLALTVSFRRWS
jgi:hypothetical protein